MKKIMHVVAGLPNGGAEAVLFNLLQGSTETQNSVICLGNEGFYGDKMAQLGTKMLYLNMKPSRFSLIAFIKMVRFIKQQRPDVIQTWLYHANLLGSIAAKIAGIKNVLWSIHQTKLTPAETKLFVFIAKFGGKISPWFARKIIYCANRSRINHEKMGYDKSKSMVIFNGYDHQCFQPNLQARQQIRTELNIQENEKLIGMIARVHPEKDHHNFLQAAKKIAQVVPNSKFLLCGTGTTADNKALMQLIDIAGMVEKMCLLGERRDIEKIFASLDLNILSSQSEAFPNVICEAMLCGVPCVSTDVGDATFIIQDTGTIVPTENSEQLAIAAIKMLKIKSTEKLKQQIRHRIKNNFTIPRMIKNYHDSYRYT